MDERVTTLAADTKEDYERRQAFKKGLRQRSISEKTSEKQAGKTAESRPAPPLKKAA